MAREKWSNRFTFILAAVGSAVGLGNAWRFPGLCAKFGGGAFLLAYILCMVVVGIPLLMMEIAIGRRMKAGAPAAMRGINKKAEFAGWAATGNAFVIATYYAVVFAWCILMAIVSYKFAFMGAGSSADTAAASSLWQNSIGTTWGTSLAGEGGDIPILVLICAVIAWAFIYGCIRNGASSVGKVVKYTVFLPVLMLIILAVKGFINNPYLGESMRTLFVPVWSEFSNPNLWINAMGQVFYSLSIMMAIMFAYGSFLKNDTNIAVDAVIIAFSDLAVSVLSGIVLFTTMYSTGMTINNMSASGIATAFIIYPTAIVQLTDIAWLNAIFGFVFYFMLCTLAIDSAFSIIEGCSAAIADKFGFVKKKTTAILSIVAAAISLLYCTGAGVGWLDIVDNWCNAYSLIICGIFETVAVGWFMSPGKEEKELNLNLSKAEQFKKWFNRPGKVLAEINKNSKGFKMPAWWFITSIKFIAPLALTAFLVWNFVALGKTGGRYNAQDYDLYAEIIGGWVLMGLSILFGLVVFLVTKCSKTLSERAKKVEDASKTWDEMEACKD